MATRPTRELTTKDDVSLRELLDMGERIIDVFEDADFPFRDLFVQKVGQDMWKQYEPGEFTWEELAEGEHPRTGEDTDPRWTTVQVAKYGRSLGLTQEFLEDHSSEHVQRRYTKMVDGVAELQRNQILDVISNGIADGRELWYHVDDYGGYEHSQTHNHKFTDTDSLFDDDGTDDTKYPAHEHVERAMDELRHHGKGDQVVCLTGAPFKRSLRDEITWNADYHIPEAERLRTRDLWRGDIPNIDGAAIMQTAWLTENEFYLVDTGTDAPVKMREKRPVQLTRANGGQVQHPGELVGASGSGRWGFKFVDPLDAVYVNATEVTDN
jgi:hypothetical protein